MIDIIKVDGVPHVLNINKPSAKRAVIFCHGFMSNKNRAYILNAAQALSHAGLKVVRFNFGVEIVSERQKVLRGVIDHVAKEVDSIGLVGNSLGGMNVILEASNPLVKALALINSVYDPRAAQERYIVVNQLFAGTMRAELTDEFLNYDLKRLVKTINKPTMVIGSDKDKIIPLSETKELYKSLTCDKQLISLKNCSHSIWRSNNIIALSNALTDWFNNKL